jgi:hypothetical protein
MTSALPYRIVCQVGSIRSFQVPPVSWPALSMRGGRWKRDCSLWLLHQTRRAREVAPGFRTRIRIRRYLWRRGLDKNLSSNHCGDLLKNRRGNPKGSGRHSPSSQISQFACSLVSVLEPAFLRAQKRIFGVGEAIIAPLSFISSMIDWMPSSPC